VHVPADLGLGEVLLPRSLVAQAGADELHDEEDGPVAVSAVTSLISTMFGWPQQAARQPASHKTLRRSGAPSLQIHLTATVSPHAP
jgi:hypothetical protein